MTLQQLRYVTAVAGTGTISHAVQQFYISQPSLTNAIRELEQEVGLALSKTESSVVSWTLLEYLRSSRQRKDTPLRFWLRLTASGHRRPSRRSFPQDNPAGTAENTAASWQCS